MFRQLAGAGIRNPETAPWLHSSSAILFSGGSTDPAFAQKAADIVALYLQPPQPQPRPAPISPVIWYIHVVGSVGSAGCRPPRVAICP